MSISKDSVNEPTIKLSEQCEKNNRSITVTKGQYAWQWNDAILYLLLLPGVVLWAARIHET